MTPHLLDLEKCVPPEGNLFVFVIPLYHYYITGIIYTIIIPFIPVYFAKLYRSGMPYPCPIVSISKSCWFLIVWKQAECVNRETHLRIQSELLPSAWPVDEPSKDQFGNSEGSIEVTAFGITFVLERISLN
jgi:hypothetical protein